jgi:hypothetical protein
MVVRRPRRRPDGQDRRAGCAGRLLRPNRFFDSIRTTLTDNFKVAIGHVYTSGRHGLTLGAEHGFALGGGVMASLIGAATFAEGGRNAVHGGLRIYLGRRDKTLTSAIARTTRQPLAVSVARTMPSNRAGCRATSRDRMSASRHRTRIRAR